jgi:hypothetical protein
VLQIAGVPRHGTERSSAGEHVSANAPLSIPVMKEQLRILAGRTRTAQGQQG